MDNKELTIDVTDRRIKIPEDNKLPMESSMNQIIVAAMNKNYPTEFIEKMMDLEVKHQKEIARRAYFEALADFKAEAPKVTKDKHNKFFDSWYTSLGMLLDTYNPFLGRHGLVISFPITQQDDKTLTVEARLTHRMGHSESLPLTAPIDQASVGKQSGQRSRNPIQDIKSTFTYLRSATCEAILGVAGTEGTFDDDGNHAGKQIEYITEDQQTEIDDYVKTIYGKKPDIFWDFAKKEFGAENASQIPVSKYDAAIKTLKSALSKLNGDA